MSSDITKKNTRMSYHLCESIHMHKITKKYRVSFLGQARDNTQQPDKISQKHLVDRLIIKLTIYAR